MLLYQLSFFFFLELLQVYKLMANFAYEKIHDEEKIQFNVPYCRTFESIISHVADY